MVHENVVVTAIGKEGTTQFANIIRCFQPAGCPGIEIAEFLQRSILLFS